MEIDGVLLYFEIIILLNLIFIVEARRFYLKWKLFDHKYEKDDEPQIRFLAFASLMAWNSWSHPSYYKWN